MTQTKHNTVRMILAAAVAMTLGSAAFAQQRVDRSGANDASNKVGSNGVNPVDNRVRPWDLNNNIVYGNVTSGKEFRGPVGSVDPRAFRGGTADRNSDVFVRNSAGVSTGGVTSYNTQGTRTFYGESRAVAPPADFVQIPGSGGYVPQRPGAWRTVDPRTGAVSGDIDFVYRPDEFNMPGAIDMQYSPGAVSVPSNVNTRGLNSTLSDYTQLNRGVDNQLSAEQAQRLFNELNGGTNVERPRNPIPANAGPDNQQQNQPNQQPAGAGPNDQVRQATLGTPMNDARNAATIDKTFTPGSTEVGIQTRLMMSADQESTYAQLQARRQQLQDNRPLRPGEAAERASQQFNQQVKDLEEAKKVDEAGGNAPGAPGAPGGAGVGNTGGGTTGGTGAAGAGKTEGDKPATPIAPVKVGSLGGDKSSALNELMTKAETSMREGKYASAIETYESAEKMAPANPLIKLGRAHAELGGAYYRRAEQDLRKTLTADQNLLSGQYDLRGALGNERLQTIERDLKDLMQKNEKDVGPAVLLAYVYYNTSNEQRAAVMLDLADKRADGKDALVKLLKKNWSLPAAGDNK